MTNKIEFPAAVYSVKTLVDGGIRLTLDLPETEIPAMAMLAECKRQGIPLFFVAKLDELENDQIETIGRTAAKRRK